MVAIAGKGWSLAPCLRAMFDEADRRWPDRSRLSDGSIGDAAHAARTSDHNPDEDGDVLAGDLTDDKASGCDADLFAEHLRKSRDPRVSLVICNGRKFKSYGTMAWQWTDYTGINDHEKHTHVSVLDTDDAKNDTSPWFPYADAPLLEEDDMPPSPAIVVVNGVRFVFVLADGGIWWKEGNGGFTRIPGGQLTSSPAAVATADAAIEVVARGTDGATWSVRRSPQGGWGSWVSLGGKS